MTPQDALPVFATLYRWESYEPWHVALDNNWNPNAEVVEVVAKAAAERTILSLRGELEALRAAAQAVVDRWETPLWKDVEPTAVFIYKLRDAIRRPPSGESGG